MDNTNLKKITIEALRESITAHKQWVANRNNGRRLDLRGYDLRGINFSYDDLRHASLSQSNLANANLYQARLVEVDFSDADLSNAQFCLADLSCACLNRATLIGTDFHGALLRETYFLNALIDDSTIFSGTNIAYAIFDNDIRSQIARLDFGGWPVTVRPTETTIGCKRRNNSDWLSWTADSPEISWMHGRAPEWWASYGDAVKEVIRTIMRCAANSK